MLGPASVKFLTFTIFGVLFFTLIFWLWQRQPQFSPPPLAEKQATDAAQEIQSPQGLTISSRDNQVVQSPEIKIEGKTNAGEFVAIASNTAQVVAKSDGAGNFGGQLALAPGLNLIEITTIPQKDTKPSQKSSTLFYDPNESVAQTVFAGSIKSIFDTLLTVTTATGDKNVRTSKTTEIEIPEDEAEAKNATARDLRIGDYAVALGSPPENGAGDENSIVATSIQIFRDAKPQNNVRVAQVQVITLPRQNLFSVKNQEDQKIIELNLTKNSKIQIEDTGGKSTDIARDKNAIIFYHTDDNKNIIDLIYLLP